MRECRICGEIDNIIRCGGHYKNNEKRQVYMCKNCGYSWVSDEQFIRDDRFRLPTQRQDFGERKK